MKKIMVKIFRKLCAYVPLCLCAFSRSSVPIRSGFTLIELLLVIALMAMIIGITAPAFIGLARGTGMRGAVAQVSSTLSLLRQWAITHHEEVTFYYFKDGGTNVLESYYYAINDSGDAIISTNHLDKYNGSPRLPMDVMFMPDNGISDSFTFKPDGGLGTVETKHVVIFDRQAYSAARDVKKTIKVNGLTGAVYVD